MLNRLAGFDASMDWAKSLDGAAPWVALVADGVTALHADDLRVALPDGTEIVRVSDLVIEPADRVLERIRSRLGQG